MLVKIQLVCLLPTASPIRKQLKNYTSLSLTVTCPARSCLSLPHWQQRKTALLSCHSWALSGRCLPLRMAGELTWQAALLRSLHMAHFQEHKAISVSSHHSNKLLSHNGYAISSPIGLFLCTCLKGVVHPKKKEIADCTQLQAIQDVDEFVSSSEHIRRNVALQYFTCSPMDPLQWMGAVRMRVQTADTKHHNN